MKRFMGGEVMEGKDGGKSRKILKEKKIERGKRDERMIPLLL